MCEHGVTMVTTETHQSQDLVVPPLHQDQQDHQDEAQVSPSATMAGFSEEMGQGPVNAITVLTLLDKLVNMLDTVQENQNKMEVSQGWGHPQGPRTVVVAQLSIKKRTQL